MLSLHFIAWVVVVCLLLIFLSCHTRNLASFSSFHPARHAKIKSGEALPSLSSALLRGAGADETLHLA